MRGIALALLLAAADAAAHGGGFPHANGGVPPGLRDPGPAPGFQDPRVPCACAGKCWLCSDGDGRVVDRVATHFWNDFAAVRIDIRRGPRTVAVHPSQPPSYGRLREEPPPDVATPVPGPSMLFVETGRSTESTRALVEITTVRGILLVQPRKRAGTRLYRSGQRVLVVRDLEPGETDRRADFVDAIHGRSLTFLDLEEARRRHRILARVASELPDLPAVEAFVKSR